MSGALHIDSYTSTTGDKKLSVNVVVDTVENADGKKNIENAETNDY